MVRNIDTASDWLDMFIKACERLYLAFVVKMHTKTREQHLRGNDQRRYLRSLSRQAGFIAEYIQLKYPEHYNEAAAYFNTLNNKYPIKPELRKTKEFRQFKAHMNGEQVKQRVKPIPQYQHINIAECSWSNMGSQVETPSQSPFGWPSSIESESPQRSPMEPESPQCSPIEPESPQRLPIEPESPQWSPMEPESPQCSPIEPESPQRLPIEPESPQWSPIEPESPQHSPIEPESPQRSPIEPESPPQTYNDNMVLRIPLLQSPQKTPPAIIAETISIVTEEITNPITLDDIPHEKVDELIKQLRDDPDLQNIFRDIEEQMEFEELGMDIDLPQHDLLEDELFGW